MENNETIAALPYVYDAENERLNTILEQVAEFCGVEFPEDEEERAKKKAVYWAKLWQVIRFISNVTCWTEQATDTFITQTRVQHFSVEQVCGCRPGCCKCDEDEILIPLDFAPVAGETPFVSGKIVVFINGEPVSEEIPVDYLNEHYDDATGKLHLIRSDFPDTLLYKNRCCCLCRRKAVITLKYNAGYDFLPAGLLPMMCPLIAKIESSKNGLNDCANTMTEVAGALKFKKIGNIQYQWSDVETTNQKTYSLYTDLYNLSTLDEVYSISRCLIAETPEEMGEVV